MGSFSITSARPVSVLSPLLLVFLGVLLLLTAVGSVSFGIWLELLNYWPVLLVLIGAEILLADSPLLLRAGLVCLTLVIAFAAAYMVMPEYQTAEPLRVSYVEPVGDIDTVHLNANFLGGELAIEAESSGHDSSAAIVVAEFSDRPARIIRRRSDGEIKIDVVSSGPHLSRTWNDGHSSGVETVNFPLGLADWTLMMSPDVEVEIEVSSLVAELDLDLRSVNVRRLSVEGAAADLKVQLPIDAGDTEVDIAAGFANVEIIVPDGVAAFIEVDAPLGSTQIDTDRFIETQEGYRSIDYPEAANRVDIDIESLSANVTVN